MLQKVGCMDSRKVVFVGSANAGKTALAVRLARDLFVDSFGSTIGVDYLRASVDVNGVTQVLQL
jgi:GTPase SAR1 family protein